jgi:translation initiation factor 2 subunit 2
MAYDYDSLLKRAREKIPERSSDGERFQLPEASIIHEGRTTIIRNFAEIAAAMRRDKAHLLKFLLKELGTSGDMDDNRVIFQGVVPERQINEKIKVYLERYVLCGVCGRPDTELVKEGRITMLRCHACGAILPVKTEI